MTGAVVFVVLSFLIYRPDDDHAWEGGEVTARSCAEAEAWVRGALQLGQAVQIGPCVPQQPRTAEVRR